MAPDGPTGADDAESGSSYPLRPAKRVTTASDFPEAAVCLVLLQDHPDGCDLHEQDQRHCPRSKNDKEVSDLLSAPHALR